MLRPTLPSPVAWRRARASIGRYVAATTLTATLLAGASCGGNDNGDATGPNDNITGTYTLRTVNGNNLPATIAQTGQNRIEFTQGSLNFNADGTYSETVTLRTTVNGQVTTQSSPDNGRYVRNGNAVTLTASGGDVVTGSISGRTFTYSENLGATFGTIVLLYER